MPSTQQSVRPATRSAPSAAPAVDLRTARSELLAADRTNASAAASMSLIDALVAPLTSDAVFLAPGDSIARGPAQARDALAKNADNATAKWSWTTIRSDVSADGTRGYTYGYSEAKLANGTITPGKFVAYWIKQPNGAWRIGAFKRVLRAAGTVSTTPPAGFQSPDVRDRPIPAKVDQSRERRAIMDLDLEFSGIAQAEGNAEAFGRYMAIDGAQTGSAASPEFVFGGTAIYNLFNQAPSGGGKFTWIPSFADVAPSGDLGFTAGFVSAERANTGKYLTIWQKQPSGAWRYVVD